MSPLLIFLPIIMVIGIFFVVLKFAPKNNRSTGINVFAAWVIFTGISMMRHVSSIGFFAFGLTVLFIGLAIGILRLNNKARIATIVAYALICCLWVLAILMTIGQPDIMARTVGNFLANLLFASVTFVFLTRPKVKEQFKG